MKCSPDDLAKQLRAEPAASFLVSGDETLLTVEAADAIRARARAAGYGDRQVFFIERGFDWDQVRNAAQSLSLFAERRILELRMPGGRPDQGAELLVSMIQDPPPDTLLLILTERLNGKVADAPWVRAVASRGVWVSVPVVKPQDLPGWLIARAARAGMKLAPDAAQLITVRAEGNMLAAAQEIEKLGLMCQGEAGLDEVNAAVGQNARYDVYALADAAAKGDAVRALSVLGVLKGEGTEPVLVLWALARALRGLWQARERERLRRGGPGSAWNLASPPSPEALRRARSLSLTRLMREAGMVDRILKGRSQGDPWMSLAVLTAGLAGASLHPSLLSGRVEP